MPENEQMSEENEQILTVLLNGVNDPTIPTEAYVDAIRDGIISLEEVENTSMNPERIRLIRNLLNPPAIVLGCMDANAINYNPNANEDDGSCVYEPPTEIHGCTDPTAQNFNPDATVDDGSCVYEPPTEIHGCTDPNAENFNPDATVDDGSCVLSPIRGCMDPNAINFNPDATVDDDSCEYLNPDFLLQGTVLSDNSPVSDVEIEIKVDSLIFNCRTNDRGVYSQIIKGDSSGVVARITFTKFQMRRLQRFLPLREQAPIIEGKRSIDLDVEMMEEGPAPPPTPPPSICSSYDQKTFEQIIKDYIDGSEGDGSNVKKCLGLEQHEFDKAVKQFRDNPPVIWDNEVPTLQARHTDHWLLGAEASGKSAILASMIYELRHRLSFESSRHDAGTGVLYKIYLFQCMKNSCMPQDTPTGAGNAPLFAYLPFDLSIPTPRETSKPAKWWRGKTKALKVPINLIEMAGEHVSALGSDDAQLEKLRWLVSPNKKILSLVFDSTKLDNAYQAQKLVECISLFKRKKVFSKIEKIFLIISKADELVEFSNFTSDVDGNVDDRYQYFSQQVEDRIKDDWPMLVNSIKDIVENENHDIMFKIVPMSVATEMVKGKFIKKNEDVFIKKYVAEMEKNLLIY